MICNGKSDIRLPRLASRKLGGGYHGPVAVRYYKSVMGYGDLARIAVNRAADIGGGGHGKRIGRLVRANGEGAAGIYDGVGAGVSAHGPRKGFILENAAPGSLHSPAHAGGQGKPVGGYIQLARQHFDAGQQGVLVSSEILRRVGVYEFGTPLAVRAVVVLFPHVGVFEGLALILKGRRRSGLAVMKAGIQQIVNEDMGLRRFLSGYELYVDAEEIPVEEDGVFKRYRKKSGGLRRYPLNEGEVRRVDLRRLLWRISGIDVEVEGRV